MQLVEQQVTSLALSQRLKELEVKQESLFYWIKETRTEGERYFVSYLHGVNDSLRRKIHIQCSAFTVAELGEMLPVGSMIPMEIPQKHFSARKWWRKSDLHIVRTTDKKWFIEYWNPTTNVRMKGQTASTEADARAKMVIYLIENGLITP